MNYAKAYARAIYDVRKEGKVVSRDALIAALSRRHHEKLLPQIIEESRRLAEEKKNEHVVRAASEYDANKGIDKLREFGISEYPRIVIDKKLVKGFVVEGKDFRFDASARRSLVDLYKRLTA